MADSVEDRRFQMLQPLSPNQRELTCKLYSRNDTQGLKIEELKQEILEQKSALIANQRKTEEIETQLTKAEKANDTLGERA